MVRGEIIIDLSNWPNHAKFMDGLPDDVNDYTEEQWLNLIIPNQDVGGLENNSPQKAYDNFLAIRRKLTELNLLADYDAVISQDLMLQIINNLKDPAITNGIKPNVAVVLGKTFRQLEADTHGLGTMEGGGRVGINNDNDDTQTVAYFNVMMCCLSETIVKEGKSYSQEDSYYGPVSIVNHLWPILTGSNVMKEFKLYLLIKIFYFDSKLYKFISPINEYSSMTYGTETIRIGNPIYEDNTLSPVHVYRLFLLHLWLRNKKASQYNSLSKQHKIGFCNSFFEVMKGEIIATHWGSLGDDGSIKILLAKYLVNKDPIYLYSAVLSNFTNPNNIFPGFDDISNTFNVLIPDRNLAPGFITGPDFTMNLMLFMGAWKAERGLEGDLDIRTRLDIDYIEKLYKALSKPVIFKKQKMSKFIKSIALFKKNFIPIANLSPKLISKLENMDNNIYNNNNSLIKLAGFYIKPIKRGYNQDEENEGNALRRRVTSLFVGSGDDKIYLGGGSKKYTRKKRIKKRRKNKRKTLKL